MKAWLRSECTHICWVAVDFCVGSNKLRIWNENRNQIGAKVAIERFGVGQKDNKGNAIATNDFDQDGVPAPQARLVPQEAQRRGVGQRGRLRVAHLRRLRRYRALLGYMEGSAAVIGTLRGLAASRTGIVSVSTPDE